VACNSKPKGLPTVESDSLYPTKTGNDSLIHITLFDLSRHTVNRPDRNEIRKAVNVSIDKDIAENFLKWAKPEDFYFIDIDNDSDLDIVYSSLLDQYRNTDLNALYIFQKISSEQYKRVSIPGYLYDTNMFETSNDTVLIKTVRRPCCDNSDFIFFYSVFRRFNWDVKTKKVLKIDRSKVRETM